MKTQFDKIPAQPNNQEWIKKKLQHMVDVDQIMRNYLNTPHNKKYSNVEKNEFEKQFMMHWPEVDSYHTSELKKLLKLHPWFTISRFGKEADKNAWLLVQHADHDIAFQRQVLVILTELYLKGETNPSNYAYLYDRVASSINDLSQRKLQRYGTQGKCTGPGLWEPFPIEDPENLDRRRKEVELETEAEYIKKFETICH